MAQLKLIRGERDTERIGNKQLTEMMPRPQRLCMSNEHTPHRLFNRHNTNKSATELDPNDGAIVTVDRTP